MKIGDVAEEEDIQINYFPQHFLYFLPLPQGQGSFLPIFAIGRVGRKDRVALCGKNGSGKSSIARLILGEPIPYQGIIRKGSRLKISYISQDTTELAGNLADYATDYGIDQTLFKTILRKLDFSRGMFNMDIKDFSDGQKKKVMIARSLCESAHLYIWDEPLNYIDVISRMQIEELLSYYKPTLLFIEHDRVFCDNIATKTILL